MTRPDEDQLEFEFEAGAWSRGSDPETSREAAESLERPQLSRLQTVVLETLVALGGSAIADELVEASGVEWKTLTPRLRPLADLDLIRDSGLRRRGRSGRNQIVWQRSKPLEEVKHGGER